MPLPSPEHGARRAVAAALVAVTATLATAAVRAQPAQTIYVGGDILTMKGPRPTYVQALAVRDGKIAYVGQKAGAMRLRGPSTELVDLKGRTLLPGFIDAHGHFVYAGKNLMDADLFGSVDVAELLARMKAHAAKVPEGAWIVGFGYLSRGLKENRAPTVEELDSVATDRPVLVVDSSGHLGAGNSAAFRAAGIDRSTPDPEGGSARWSTKRSHQGAVYASACSRCGPTSTSAT